MKFSIINIVIVLCATLFSLPDTRFFGISSLNYLFILLLIGVIFYRKKHITSLFLRFNSPFVFLLFYSILTIAFKYSEYSIDDLYYVLNHNKELFVELMLSLVVFSYAIVFRTKKDIIPKFIEIYFLLNGLYLIVGFLFPEVKIFFHQTVNNYFGILEKREFMLGFEPSYTVPVNIILSFLYYLIQGKSKRSILFILMTLYSLVYGVSKTGYIMIFLLIYLFIYFTYISGSRYKLVLIPIILVTSIYSLFIVVSIVENNYSINNFYKLTRLEQLPYISYITRTELIAETSDLMYSNPLGVGYGNSVLLLSDAIERDMSKFESFEIEYAHRYSRSSKSQLLEYSLSGGIIFLFLLIYTIFKLYVEIHNYHVLDKRKEKILFIIIILTFLIGERLPIILALNMFYAHLLMRGRYSHEDSNE